MYGKYHDALEKELENQPPVIILTGQVQEGKTSYLISMIDRLKIEGFSLEGIIARGVHDGEERLGYDLKT